MAALDSDIIVVSYKLDENGLVWHPEIGDEVVTRGEDPRVSILVDPQGLTPKELRQAFVWLPTVEQMVVQIEAREGLVYHAGVSATLHYEAVIKTASGLIEASAATLRAAFARALDSLLAHRVQGALH